MSNPAVARTVAAVHTAGPMLEPTKQLFAELLPGVRLINLLDDSLIQDVIQAGTVTPAVARRLVTYFFAAAEAGAEVIFNTCSSVGDIVESARVLVPVPIVRIDEAMALEAVAAADSVGVLATLPTTLAPTVKLLRQKASQVGRQVEVLEGLAEGAFQALLAGQAAAHDQLILRTAMRVAAQSQVLVLAQGSMARMETTLAEATGKPVLSSPRRGVLAVKALLEKLEARETRNPGKTA